MDNTDRHISTLWEQAKVEAPQKSFEETQAAFTASASGAGGASSGFDSIINLNSIIMSSIVIVAVSLVWSFWPSVEVETAVAEQETTAISNQTPAAKNQRTVIVTVPKKGTQKKGLSSIELLSEKENAKEKMTEVRESSDGQSPQYIDEKRKVSNYSPGQKWEYGGSHPAERGAEAGDIEVHFVLTNDTKIEELERIKSLAAKAGIILEYKTRGSIKWIHVEMIMDGEDGESKTSITMNGNFEMTIGWIEDDNGKAVRYSNGQEAVDRIGLFGEGEGMPFMDIPEIPGIPALPESPELFGDNEVPVLAAGEQRIIIQINRNTTEAEIKQYELEADRVGLSLEVLKFNPKGKRLRIKLDGPEACMLHTTNVDSRDDPLEATFGWVIDESGNYVRFLESEEFELEED